MRMVIRDPRKTVSFSGDAVLSLGYLSSFHETFKGKALLALSACIFDCFVTFDLEAIPS